MGFGGLWISLCAKPDALGRVDLHTRAVTLVPDVGPADREGGIAASGDSVWLVIDKRATLARIDPQTLRIRQRIGVPPGSLIRFTVMASFGLHDRQVPRYPLAPSRAPS